MIKKLTILLLVLFLSSFAFADNVLEDFNEETEGIDQYMEKTIPVLNEELRRLRKRVDADTDELVAASSGDTAGYLDAKVKNSIEVDSNDLQLVGDEAAPGNNKVYGTGAGGAKGWKADTVGGLTGTLIYVYNGAATSDANFWWSDAYVNYGEYGMNATGYLVEEPTATTDRFTRFLYKGCKAGAGNNKWTGAIQSKWIKKPGINTLDFYIYALRHQNSATAWVELTFRAGTESTTYRLTGPYAEAVDWEGGDANHQIDVSGLSDGTVYNLSIDIESWSSGAGSQYYAKIAIYQILVFAY